MRFDFSSVGDIDSFVSVPAGVYACRVAEARSGQSKDGSERWSFRLEVDEGEYAGRTASVVTARIGPIIVEKFDTQPGKLSLKFAISRRLTKQSKIGGK